MTNTQFAILMAALAMLNTSIVVVCIWLRRIYFRLNRLAPRETGSARGGAFTYYATDEP